MVTDFSWQFSGTHFHGITWQPERFSHVMIMIHGIGEHVGRYGHVAEFFQQEGYLVTGIDHFGHGGSDGKRGAAKKLEEIFDYLQGFIQYVQEAYQVPVVLYGHSMGGGILTGLLLHRQPDVLAAIISGPAYIVGSKPNAFLRGVLKVGATLFPQVRVTPGLDIHQISHDQKEVEKFQQDPLRHDKASLRLMDILVSNGAWCLEHADRLTVPSLLIHGNADTFTSVEGSRLFAERAPKKLLTYKEWDGFYHELHNEPGKIEVLQFIAGWLSHFAS
ncbi:lysophospholipase [Chitinophaga niabensis]|uniref:alpha/beta hydrolase n=1 Tax=Chitinophaga niabensis TaxID=536979 RepID=UPI0031BB2434